MRSPLSSVGDLPRLLTVGDASRNCCWCRLAERSNPVLESRLCISLTPMQSSYPPLYRWTIGPSTTRDPPPRDTACAPRSRRRSPGGLGRHLVVGHGDDDHLGQPPLPEDGPGHDGVAAVADDPLHREPAYLAADGEGGGRPEAAYGAMEGIGRRLI